MLGLHFIDQRVASDDARVANPQNEFQMFGARVPFPSVANNAANSRVWMYLDNTTLMVDGLGVGAAVIEPDITVTNGVVHIIGENGREIQGDHSGCFKPPVDTIAKVPL